MRRITVSQLAEDTGKVLSWLSGEDGVLLTDNNGETIGVLLHEDEYALLSEIAALAANPSTLSSLASDQESTYNIERQCPRRTFFTASGGLSKVRIIKYSGEGHGRPEFFRSGL